MSIDELMAKYGSMADTSMDVDAESDHGENFFFFFPALKLQLKKKMKNQKIFNDDTIPFLKVREPFNSTLFRAVIEAFV